MGEGEEGRKHASQYPISPLYSIVYGQIQVKNSRVTAARRAFSSHIPTGISVYSVRHLTFAPVRSKSRSEPNRPRDIRQNDNSPTRKVSMGYGCALFHDPRRPPQPVLCALSMAVGRPDVCPIFFPHVCRHGRVSPIFQPSVI